MVLALYIVTLHHDLMHKSQFGCCDPRRGRQLARMHNPGNALLHNARSVEMMIAMTMTMSMTSDDSHNNNNKGEYCDGHDDGDGGGEDDV